MNDYFDWMAHLIDAARHSPQALEFVRKSLTADEKRVYNRTGNTRGIQNAACELDKLIFEQRLVYSVYFQTTPDSVVPLNVLLDAMYSKCPQWQFHPTSDYRWTNIKKDGIIDRKDLISRIKNGGRTEGGFLYERIDAFINQDAFVLLKVMCPDLYLKDDYSDLVR